MRSWQAVAIGVIVWFVVLTPLMTFVPGTAVLLGFFPFSWVDGVLVGALTRGSRRSWIPAGVAGAGVYLLQVGIGFAMAAEEGAFPPAVAPLRGAVSLVATLAGFCLGGATADYLRRHRTR
ncbi:MAG: hypothetical protein ACE149_18080 [Armatimonadota bacterium]